VEDYSYHSDFIQPQISIGSQILLFITFTSSKLTRFYSAFIFFLITYLRYQSVHFSLGYCLYFGFNYFPHRKCQRNSLFILIIAIAKSFRKLFLLHIDFISNLIMILSFLAVCYCYYLLFYHLLHFYCLDFTLIYLTKKNSFDLDFLPLHFVHHDQLLFHLRIDLGEYLHFLQNLDGLY